MASEADTCRRLIAPKLQAAGWENEPHSIAEQRTFTDGRIVVSGNRARRRPGKRADYILRYTLMNQFAERGIDFPTLALQAGQSGADPFDVLCHLAFNAPMLTRRERADRVKRQETAFFNYFAPEAREILDLLLEKYASDGELQFTLPDVLKVPPISQRGNVNEIIGKFGGADELRNAVNQLQTLLYAA